MKNGVTVIVDDTTKVVSGLNLLASTRVMVGVPAEKTNRDDPITNAALAYIHDHGAPEVGIPARPFMEPGIESVQVKIEDTLYLTAQAASDGKPEAVERGFQRAGLIAQAGIRAKITEGPFEPLKPSTLAARRRRGRTGTKPLLDTGQMRNAINYVIRKV